MKYLVFLVAFLFFVSCSQRADDADNHDQNNEHEHSDAVETDIPDVVIKAFEAKFPDAQDVEWEKEDNGYEAEYEVGGVEYEAEFDNAVNWVDTEKEIKVSDLPAVYAEAVNNNYTGYENGEVERRDTQEYTGIYAIESV